MRAAPRPPAPYRYRAQKSRFSSRRPVSRLSVEAFETRALLSAGLLDPSFGSGGGVTTHFVATATDTASAVLVQPLDSKILIGGTATSTTPGTPDSFALACFNTDGTLDSTFGTGGRAYPVAVGTFAGMVLQADGKIVVAGTGPSMGDGPQAFVVTRLNANGSPDSSFGLGHAVITDFGHPTGETVSGVALQGDKIVVAGYSPQALGLNATFLDVARYNTDGSLDGTFGTGGKQSIVSSRVSGFVVQTDGKLVFAGTRDTAVVPSNNTVWYVNRLNPDGSIDTSFGQGGAVAVDLDGGTGGPYSLALQPDGRIVVFGFAGHDQILARLNPDGSLDGSFGVGGRLFVDTAGSRTLILNDAHIAGNLALQADGSILVAGPGSFTSNPYAPVNSVLLRYRPNGSLDTRFGMAGQAAVPLTASRGGGLAVQADGRIVVAGTTGPAEGPTDFAVARYQGGPGDAPAGTPSQRFIAQVYLDLLGRTVDPAGLSFWSAFLDQGSGTRAQVVQGIEDSPEFHALVVGQLFEHYLQRAPEPAALTAATDFLAQGGTPDQAKALILGSDEYAILTGMDAPFLPAVYHDVLYRNIDPAGAQAWGQLLDIGASHLAVATAILQSVEAEMDEVQGLYHRFLHRAADPAGLEAMVSALRGGESSEAVIATLVGSDEYFNALGSSGS
jgi:uncharacterized delta-60 repeat protein